MDNTVKGKAMALADILQKHRLCKQAQEIDNKEVTDLGAVGKEMQKEIEGREDGANYSSEPSTENAVDTVRQEVGVQDLNKPAETALSETGTDVNTMTSDGDPAKQIKSASYKARLSVFFKEANRQAAVAAEPEIYTGTAALQKFASVSSEESAKEAHDYFTKLAATNPVFGLAREAALMRKCAEDIDAAIAASGVSPEEAAGALQEAIESDPAAAEELSSEADGEAVADLAAAEEQAGQMMEGLQQMAAGASEQLGVEVTPEDIVAAAEEVVDQAEQLGVEPEELIAAAVEEMGGAEMAPEGASEEDIALAEQILDDAAANGVSPDEVLQIAAESLAADGDAAPAEVPAEEPAAPVAEETEATQEKAAALQKLRGSIRGRRLLGL